MILKKNRARAIITALLLSLSPISTVFASDNVTMSIKDGDIRDVLTALSNLGDQSIVTDETVKGKVSISFDNVPFDTALDLVTRTKGLAYRNIHGVIVVSSQEQINKYYGDVAIFKLNYAKAEDAKTILKDIIKGDGAGVSVDPITNSIVFTGNRADEQKVRDTLALVDIPTKQVTLEAKLSPLTMKIVKTLALPGIGTFYHKLLPVPLPALPALPVLPLIPTLNMAESSILVMATNLVFGQH